MISKFLIAIGIFVAVVVALGAVKAEQIKEASSAPHVQPLTSVSSIEAKAVAWQPTISAIGTMAPVEGVTIAPDADGVVVKIGAENGASVKAGDMLVELDTTVEVAQLAAAQARQQLAKLQRDRSADLAEKKTISQAELDQANAAYAQAEADVTGLKATIDKKHVRAPFDGRVGIRQINLGQFVARGRGLMPLQKLNPIYVNFNLPQRVLPSLSIGQKVSVGVDAYPSPFVGTISAINSEVDSSTRNVQIQATVANADEKLRSGMFAQVEVELPVGKPQIVLPATAIQYSPYGNSVFIIEKMKGDDGKEFLGVRQQFIKIGATRGDLIAVDDGVKPGEQVVTAGIFKLRNKMPVQVNNTVAPTANPDPKPANT